MLSRLPLLAAIAALSTSIGCQGESAAPDPEQTECRGDVLFGRPVPATGLSEAECQPRCSCGGASWEAPDYGEPDIESLAKWHLETPYAELSSDPYDAPPPASNDAPDEVCAVVRAAAGSYDYTLSTFPTADDATAAGAIVTHFGACGLCSPLQDLAVYMRFPDLTAPVRDCGVEHVTGPMEAHLSCLLDLGFDLPCAQIWYHNTIHTSSECASPCLAAASAPYHTPDGALNACLSCDEEKSGPVFKAVAGRTRRNTGIASAMCRPCSEVKPLIHAYP